MSAAVRGPRTKRSLDRTSLLVVFLGLPFLFYVVVVLYPFTQAAYYSLTGWSGFSPAQPFVGLANYASLLGDARFTTAVANSVTLLVVVPVVTLTLSFVLAALLTFGGATAGSVRGLSRSGFYRVVSFFPYVVPAIVVGIIWSQIYNPANGLLNGVLTGLGLSRFDSFPWLGKVSTAMGSSMAVIVWSFIGFYMVLFVAAIRSIPVELFEAARIDGAGRVRSALSVALPGILGTVRTAYVYIGISALDAFVYMQALNPGGGPDSSTLVITQEVYSTAFRQGRFGLACAMGVVLAVVTFVFVALVFLVVRLASASPRRPRRGAGAPATALPGGARA